MLNMLSATRQQTAIPRGLTCASSCELKWAVASTSRGQRTAQIVLHRDYSRKWSAVSMVRASHTNKSVESSSNWTDAGPNFNLVRTPHPPASPPQAPTTNSAASQPAVLNASPPLSMSVKSSRKRRKEIRAALRIKLKEEKLKARKVNTERKIASYNEKFKELARGHNELAQENREDQERESLYLASEEDSFAADKPQSLLDRMVSKLSGRSSTERRLDEHENTLPQGDHKPSSVALLRGREFRSREKKAALNAQVVDEGRLKRHEDALAVQDEYQRLVTDMPGTGAGTRVTYLDFEATNMRYPPKSIYPPALPTLGDVDTVLMARIHNVHRYAEVEWAPEHNGRPAHWRRTMRPVQYYEEKRLFEFLDGEQSFEYIGDSVLHLVSRSILMTRFPKRAPYAYNIAANFLVSNDVFGHIYDDANLGEERRRVWKQLVMENVEQAIAQAVREEGLDEAGVRERREASIPEYQVPDSHQRKADLFEAYTGALYFTRGFTEASRWTTQLFEPWIDRVARTPRFQSDVTLSAAGLAERKAQLVDMRLKDEQRRRVKLASMGTVQRLMRSMLLSVLPRRLLPELRSVKRDKGEQ